MVIDHLRKSNVQLVEYLQNGGLLYLPLTWMGELYAGVECSSQPAKTLAGVKVLLNSVTVLYPDEVTAGHYGKIYAELAKAGTPIPQNDVWIAALAREYQLPIATRDNHFERVPGLVVLRW